MFKQNCQQQKVYEQKFQNIAMNIAEEGQLFQVTKSWIMVYGKASSLP